jgi:hypothetical protein
MEQPESIMAPSAAVPAAAGISLGARSGRERFNINRVVSLNSSAITLSARTTLFAFAA